MKNKKCPTCGNAMKGTQVEVEIEMRKPKMSKALMKDKKIAQKEEKIADVMEEYKEGKLRSGSKKGPKVKKRKQAIAIAISEAKPKKKKKSRK